MASWLAADWPAPRDVVAGCTLRGGGVSQAEFRSLNIAAHVGDDAAAVAENRRRFAKMCELPSEPLWLNQVHGTRVSAGDDRSRAADAIVSDERSAVCVIQTADCLPVVFAAADGSEVAAAHAGWRGLVGGVLEATLRSMATPPAALLAWFGPAILQAAFEVGPEVRDAFVAADPACAECFAANAAGRWQADLCGLARRRLAAAGVAHVYGGDRCTFSEPEAFFSYRRDGACGRMATFIYRR